MLAGTASDPGVDRDGLRPVEEAVRLKRGHGLSDHAPVAITIEKE